MSDDRTSSNAYGPGTPCSQCGVPLDDDCPEWAGYCHKHAYKRTHPILAELEDLVAEWRDRYDDDEVLPAWESGEDYGRRMAADELEALLGEYKDE